MSAIGLYLVRCSDSGAAVTLAHLVESEIEQRVITNCGHQMERRNRRGSLRTAGPLDGECSFCPPRVGMYPTIRHEDAAANRTRILQASEDVPEPVASEQDDSGVPR